LKYTAGVTRGGETLQFVAGEENGEGKRPPSPPPISVMNQANASFVLLGEEPATRSWRASPRGPWEKPEKKGILSGDGIEGRAPLKGGHSALLCISRPGGTTGKGLDQGKKTRQGSEHSIQQPTDHGADCSNARWASERKAKTQRIKERKPCWTLSDIFPKQWVLKGKGLRKSPTADSVKIRLLARTDEPRKLNRD